MGSFDVFSGGFGDSSRGLEAGGMVHGTGSWIGGGSACGLSAGVTWITACRLATGTESREMMWSSFFDIASCFSKTCTCLLAIAVSSSRSVDRGVDTVPGWLLQISKDRPDKACGSDVAARL